MLKAWSYRGSGKDEQSLAQFLTYEEDANDGYLLYAYFLFARSCGLGFWEEKRFIILLL